MANHSPTRWHRSALVASSRNPAVSHEQFYFLALCSEESLCVSPAFSSNDGPTCYCLLRPDLSPISKSGGLVKSPFYTRYALVYPGKLLCHLRNHRLSTSGTKLE